MCNTPPSQVFFLRMPGEEVKQFMPPLLLGAENAERFRAPSYIQLGVVTDFFNTHAGRKSKTFDDPVNNTTGANPRHSRRAAQDGPGRRRG
jgi:hypothetical protein